MCKTHTHDDAHIRVNRLTAVQMEIETSKKQLAQTKEALVEHSFTFPHIVCVRKPKPFVNVQ